MIDLLIRTQLARYLEGTITFIDFEDWFVPGTWNVELTGEADAQDIVEEVSDALFDVSVGDLTEDEFKERIRPLARRATEARMTEGGPSRPLTAAASEPITAPSAARTLIPG